MTLKVVRIRMMVVVVPAKRSLAKRWLLSIQGKPMPLSAGTLGGTAAVSGLCAGTLITPPGARAKFGPYAPDSSYEVARP